MILVDLVLFYCNIFNPTPSIIQLSILHRFSVTVKMTLFRTLNKTNKIFLNFLFAYFKKIVSSDPQSLN